MELKSKVLENKNVVKADRLEIGNNIFKYDHAVIQLSNISYFDVSPMSKLAYPLWAFAGIVIGFLLLFTGQITLIVIGLIAMAVCAYIVYNTYDNNRKLGDYLILALNSGKIFYFSCYNKQFLYEVENILIKCFKDRSLKYSVDMNGCVIVHQEENMIHNEGNIVNGNDNTVNGNIVNGNDNTVSGVGNINKGELITNEEWAKLEDAFKEIVSKTEINSYEHMLAVSAQYQITKKDKMGLRKVLTENLNDFKNSIFSKIALGGVMEILKRIIQ